jgi:hypothetical protein
MARSPARRVKNRGDSKIGANRKLERGIESRQNVFNCRRETRNTAYWRSSVRRVTCPQKCVCPPTINVELARTAPHYDELPWAESRGTGRVGPRVLCEKPQCAGDLFITPVRRERFMFTHVDEIDSESRPPPSFFHHGSLQYAILARVLHRMKKPQSHPERSSFTLLQNGAASAAR